MIKQKIVFFHLYNDFSGSPMILRTVVKGFVDRGFDIELLTSKGGILDTLEERENYKRFSFFYRYSKYPLLTILRFIWAQLYMFVFAFRYIFRGNTTFYINTILPVGPAIAGRLMGKRVVYHCHENAWMKGRIYKELSRVMTWVADEIICVSEYQRNTLASKRHAIVVPNAISDTFREKLRPDSQRAFRNKEILMACSAKLYKGIREFIAVASKLPHYHFTLILNISENDKQHFLDENQLYLTDNVTVMSRVDNMHDFYNNASLVLNLSDKRRIIETWGLTIAEGLSAGLPCIVPETGGVKELVKEGVTGYHLNCQNVDAVAEKIDYLLSHEDVVYEKMSTAALESSKAFDESAMVDGIIAITVHEA